MASIPEELEAVVMSLPRDERAELARRLIASLDDDQEIASAWEAEVRSRLRAYRAGEAQTVSADEVFADARERLDS